MSYPHDQQGYWRLPALSTLVSGLMASTPLSLTNGFLPPDMEPTAFTPSGVAIIVEERQEFLTEAQAFVEQHPAVFDKVSMMAVGVRRLPRDTSSLHCCGVGAPAALMQHVTRCIREGRLGREVYLLTEPLRAQWWGSAFRRQAELQRLHCSSYAVGVLASTWSEAELLTNGAEIIEQAQALVREMSALGIEPINGFEPGGAYQQALEQLQKS